MRIGENMWVTHVAGSLVLLHASPMPGLVLPLPLSQALCMTDSTWAAEEAVR